MYSNLDEEKKNISSQFNEYGNFYKNELTHVTKQQNTMFTFLIEKQTGHDVTQPYKN